MATTTNYGWTTPDDTALVKDGAAAIRTLGSSIDTTTKNLNPSTTLGDIEYRSSSANTNTRLAIGATGNVLTVAGGVPTWAAPAGGGATSYALLNAGGTSLTSGTTTISSLSGYNKLFVVMVDSASFTSTGQTLQIRFNSDSTSNYRYGINKVAGYSSWASSNVFVGTYNTTTEIQAADNSTNANSIFAGFMAIDGANSSGIKMFNWSFGVSAAGGEGNVNYTGGGNYLGSSVISSISFICPSGTWDAGTVYIYGAN
jgi:hypothetical protein